MTSFLQYVADDLRRKFGNNLSRLTVVSPNKRAGIFLNEYLLSPQSEEADADVVVWSPRYVSISELFCSMSPLTVADSIEVVCRIYRLYKELALTDEPLDSFYGWGERLLNDYDDIDKNMADAARLFRNLSEIKELESTDYVTAEQERVLQEFFADFSLQKNSTLRNNFLKLWNILHPIYVRLNEDLKAEGKAYEGAIARSVVEQIMSGTIPLPDDTDTFVFIGFNVLNKTEERLFEFLQKEGKAVFYWDYDEFYIGEHSGFEAGVFLRSNLKNFPNELPRSCFDNLRRNKDIEFVSAPTENIQARSVAPWLKQHLTPDEKRTAIVLCNEGLLEPILHVLPPEVEEVNITKGYPLAHTDAYRIVERYSAGSARKGTDNAAHLQKLAEKIREAALTLREQEDSLHKTLHTEAYFLTYTIVNRFVRLVDEGWLVVEPTTLFKLVRQIMRQTSVPFHGEPAAGIQIMGMLETRCLDFESLLVLSANEGKLPTAQTDVSFIPYPLRREFGLTTPRHRIAVFAYYFFRLIQRAAHVRIVYNSSASGMSTGEMSRFMTQLLLESRLSIKRFALTNRQSVNMCLPQPVGKPADMAGRIPKISPTAVNQYLRCPLSFYYNYLANIKTDTPEASIIEPNKLGNVFHKTAEMFYTDLSARHGGIITPEMLSLHLEKDAEPTLTDYIRRAMAEVDVPPNVLVERTILNYLRLLIMRDKELGTFRFKCAETPASLTLQIPINGVPADIEIGGIVDRMDIVSGADGRGDCLRIVDYKTGGKIEKCKSVEHMFVPGKDHPHYCLQVCTYALMMLDNSKGDIKPALFFVHHAGESNFTTDIIIDKVPLADFREIADEFRDRLAELLTEIYSPEVPFAPTTVKKNCSGCAYYDICYH